MRPDGESPAIFRSKARDFRGGKELQSSSEDVPFEIVSHEGQEKQPGISFVGYNGLRRVAPLKQSLDIVAEPNTQAEDGLVVFQL
jgi:hypothetical protein